ncbi:MAG TPA: hypothetical protein VNZ01_02590 [Solirubrobacteraceae bacterium]|jgi:hypothetical protein|nr:hypothetical protein [Solirubrobacteraceae bacterium]
MSVSIPRRGVAVLTAAGALLLTLLVAAPRAEASPLYACVKKDGNAHIFTKKPKCKKGEKKLSWNTEGIPGKNGLNGLNGTNGTSGTNGKEGPPGPYVDTLPSGKSEKGVWAIIENGKSGGTLATAISFPIPLSSTPTVHFIPFEAAPPPGCSGSVSAPVAAPGNLCVFNSIALINLEFLEFYTPETNTNLAKVAGKTGTLVVFVSNLEGNQQATGTWAVTQ